MSDHHDEVPALSETARRFLDAHAATGEPTAEALARAQERLLAASRRARVTPMRSWVPLEAMAAAAVLIALVGIHAVYVVAKSPKSEPQTQPQLGRPPEVQPVIAAYRAGKLDEALRLASADDCKAEDCRSLALKLSKFIPLAQRIDSLSLDELEWLRTFDFAMMSGEQSPSEVGRQIDRRLISLRTEIRPDTPETERLAIEARQAMRDQNFTLAVSRLERCLRIEPNNLPCIRLMASGHAALAAVNSSGASLSTARSYYERYLEVAPPNDRYVPQIRRILQDAP